MWLSPNILEKKIQEFLDSLTFGTLNSIDIRLDDNNYYIVVIQYMEDSRGTTQHDPVPGVTP